MRICVIGAGASGLTAIKACKEENVEVVCYEKSESLGGLWAYNENDFTVTTVARSTIINSSKELSAFSDFVPPSDFPNYMHHTLMLEYFNMYAQHFELKKHIVYRTEVLKVQEADDYDTTGKWHVTAKDLNTDEVKGEIFDSVMVCTGHHTKAKWPKFKNQDLFEGEISHVHTYKKPDGFENKRCCVVGIGNSGGDLAAELSTVTKTKVFLSTRRGSWIISRMTRNGLPTDAFLIRRFDDLLFNYAPNLMTSIFETLIENRFDHELYNLKPKHRVFSQHPTVNDSLPNRILSGTVAVKPDIEEFTSNGVRFKGEKEVTELDCVLFATGYQMNFPFLEERLIDTKENQVNLYKYQYMPSLRHPHTLAIIGLIQPFGPLIPISELQARWHLQLMKQKCNPLPSIDIMLQDISKKKNYLQKRYYRSNRHTAQVDVVSFMDEVAEQFGAKPNLVKLLYSDPLIWWRCIFSTSLPYQYRLIGPNSNYRNAREAIIHYDERVKAALKTNQEFQENPQSLIQRTTNALFSILVFVFLLFFK